VDPQGLASALNVTVLEVADLRVLGEAHRKGPGHEIRIRKALPRVRKRFTIAHEIAHVILDHRKRRLPGTAQLEQLCDRIAAALLMPRTALRGRIQKIAVDEIIRLRQEFDVSLQTASLRFAAFTGCAVFLTEITRTGEDAHQNLQIKKLAGPLAANDTTLRYTLAVCLRDQRPAVVPLQHGRGVVVWDVEFAPLELGRTLFLLRPRR